MQHLSLHGINSIACARVINLECSLRLTSLSLLLASTPHVAAKPLFEAALHDCQACLASSDAEQWPRAAASLQGKALELCISQRDVASRNLVGRAFLESVLITCITVELLAARASSRQGGIALDLRLSDHLTQAVGSVRAGCIEKWGCAPCFSIEKDAALPLCVGVPALVAHSITELLKNAAQSTMERFGTMGLDDAPPIEVSGSAIGDTVALSVADQGLGVAVGTPGSGARVRWHAPFPFFKTFWPRQARAQGEEGQDWRYSRNFGSSFFGWGVGLARAGLHASIHGGQCTLGSRPDGQQGAVATFTIRRDGMAVYDPHPLLRRSGALQLGSLDAFHVNVSK